MFKVTISFWITLLTSVLASCVIRPYPTPTVSTPRTEVEIKDLPLRLRWSRHLPETMLVARAPLACAEDKGAAIAESHLSPWHGIVIFDDEGQVLRNYPEGWSSSALAMDDERLYVVELPELRAYNIETGLLVWSTQEGLEYRLSPNLFLEPDGTLVFYDRGRMNTYQPDDGTLLESETFPDDDLVQWYDGLDFRSPPKGKTLYATDSTNGEQLVWQTDLSAKTVLLSNEDHLIGEYFIPDNGVQVCSVRMDDGHIAWCKKKNLWSNMVIRNGIGYAVNIRDELIGFRLDDGEDIGRVAFQPISEGEFRHQVAVCDDHLLVFMHTPDELYWFDFQTTMQDQ